MSSSTFDFPSDLSPFPRDTQDILRMAHELGWSIRWNGNNKHVVQIHSPIEASKAITIPSTSLNADRQRSTVRQIARYSDQDKVADYVDSAVTVRNSGAMRLALGVGPEPPKPRAHATRHPTIVDTSVAAAMREAEVRAAAADKAIETYDEVVSQGCDTPIYRDGDESVHLVTSKPWMVRRGGQEGGSGTMYESPVVIERIWSDGAVDYRCKGCEYVNDNPRSVSAHSARKHKDGQGKAPQPAGRKVTNYVGSGIQHPASAARRLATEIIHALDGLDDWASMDPAELAKVVAEHVYQQRPDREPVAPLTPQQIIDRIVGLVDAGRLADMHQQVEAAAAALRNSAEAHQTLMRDLDEAQGEVTRLREERRALAALLSEERDGS